MPSARLIEDITSAPWFARPWSPFALMDTDLRILGVNQALATATHQDPEHLLHRHVFEAFPQNPSRAGEASVVEPLERVLRTGEREVRPLRRYDVPDPARPGAFLPKVWLPVHIPVLEDGHVVGLLHHCQEVPIDHPSGAGAALSDFDPAELVLAEEALREEFPTTSMEALLGILTDSQRIILDVLRTNDLGKTIELARMRLELETRTPGRFA